MCADNHHNDSVSPDSPPGLARDTPAPGYHLKRIPRGTFGEISKIAEELAELEDAHEQGSKIMALVELSDLIGAVRGYLARHHVGITLKDLDQFSRITERAFVNGHRVARDA